MPFSIRPFRRVPVHGVVTDHGDRSLIYRRPTFRVSGQSCRASIDSTRRSSICSVVVGGREAQLETSAATSEGNSCMSCVRVDYSRHRHAFMRSDKDFLRPTV